MVLLPEGLIESIPEFYALLQVRYILFFNPAPYKFLHSNVQVLNLVNV